MKYLITFGFLFFIISQESAQIVKTKDGVSLGTRKEFISDCVSSAKVSVMNIKGLEVKTYDYCSCLCDKLIPTLNNKDIEEASKNNKLAEFLLNDKNLAIQLDCMAGNVTVTDNFKFDDASNSEIAKKILTKKCVNGVVKDSVNKGVWTLKMAEEYCSCIHQAMYSKGYTYKEINQYENENSTAFNEIIIPCVNDILKQRPVSHLTNSYVSKDIIGSVLSSNVSLLDYLGKGFKVKISFGSVTQYFLFDTGANDLIINSEIENELLLNGSLKKENYIGTREYTLADNKTVKAQLVKLNNIKIGDYTVNNATVAIIKDGSLLCGKSFLDKFKKWELIKEKNLLILYR